MPFSIITKTPCTQPPHSPWHRQWYWALALLVGAMSISLGLAVWDAQNRWTPPGREHITLVKLTLYWSCWLVLPVLFILNLWRVWTHFQAQRPRTAIPHAAFMLLWGLGIWASLIEPRLLRERYFSVGGAPAHLPELRLALVSDLHWGLYFRESQFKRLVEQLNALDVDAIVIPGDWTYEPTTDLHTGLAPLATLNKPVFGVLGNHDLQAPGPNLALPLRAALEAHGVRLLEGQRLSWRGWEWVGLDDDWGGDPDPQIHHLWPTLTAPQQSPSSRLVVVHQPNTVSKLPRHAAFLSVAGHTHGGQIWLPGLTPRILQRMSPRGWWNGLYSTPAGHLFVTPGIGTIGLPARLGVMPTIDIVSLVHDNPMH